MEERGKIRKVEGFLLCGERNSAGNGSVGLMYLDFAPVFHQGNENMISLSKHYKNNFQKFYLASAFRKSASLR